MPVLLGKTVALEHTLSMGPIALGRQHLVELYGCCPDAINNKEKVRFAMIEAANRAQATIVADVFHEFNPHGISGVVVIAESHLAVHSWPEHGCVSVDIFTCSERMNPELAIAYLSSAFKAQNMVVKKIDRGVRSEEANVLPQTVFGSR